jgi:SAM-dependent methyltransferase
MKFHTKFKYTDRQTKAEYVWEKYAPILRGRILDVGADQCYLKDHLPDGVDYYGIGLGESVDQVVDLEKQKIPFDDKTFDCVICLDVLEHVDNIHEVFGELCRVSKDHVIISLPNPWGSFYTSLTVQYYRPDKPMKFYGLPVEPPEDRHKWFFSPEEAERFIRYQAEKHGMDVLQLDVEKWGNPRSVIKFRKDFDRKNLSNGPTWAVLRRAHRK